VESFDVSLALVNVVKILVRFSSAVSFEFEIGDCGKFKRIHKF
jgi:hypothetical protein